MLVATLVWGTLHPVGKLILQEATPLQLVLARTALTGVTLTLLLVALGRLRRVGDELRRRPWRIVGLGLLSFFASSGLSMVGLKLLPASINSLMANTSPLMLALGVMGIGLWRGRSAADSGDTPAPPELSKGSVPGEGAASATGAGAGPVSSGRRLPGGRVLVGVLLGFGGVALLSWKGAAELGWEGLLGAVLSLGGSAAWAVYTGWSRRELSTGDPLALTTAASFVGTAPLLAYGLLSGDVAAYPALGEQTLQLLAYAGVFGTALTYALWMTGLQRLSATSVSAFQYVIPLTAVTLAVVLLGEPLTVQLVVGGLAILVGVALAQERLTASGRG